MKSLILLAIISVGLWIARRCGPKVEYVGDRAPMAALLRNADEMRASIKRYDTIDRWILIVAGLFVLRIMLHFNGLPLWQDGP